MLFIGLGILILVGVILAIVLPLTLKKKDDPIDNPSDPYTYKEFNPFGLDKTTVVETMNSASFVLNQAQ